MNQTEFRGRHSVFWRVAAALVVVQLATGILATTLSAYLASDRSADLAENSIRVRLDAFAEEIERAGIFSIDGSLDIPPALESNLTFRFPDPVILADINGTPLLTIFPDPGAFEGAVADSTSAPALPSNYLRYIESGEIVVDRSSAQIKGGFAVAPLFDASGLLAGGFVLQPVGRTMTRELAPTRTAYRVALATVLSVSFVLAIILAITFTWWLVRPLQRITQRVLEIGAGNFNARVDVSGEDEIARLGSTINLMAQQVEASVETLQNTDRMRRELVANVGHDLRTPLAAIRGHLEEAARFQEEGREEEAMGAMGSAEKQAGYLQKLVDDLFELSQLENPEPVLRSEPVPVAELIHDATRSYLKSAADDGVEFKTQIEPDLPILQADGVRLKRLLDNLISNACRFTPSGGTILVSTSRLDRHLKIVVADTGDGMDDESLRHVFDRYYRGKASRTRDEYGTGLGLAISQAIAELHGGTLTAESKEHEGTTMTLLLPLD